MGLIQYLALLLLLAVVVGVFKLTLRGQMLMVYLGVLAAAVHLTKVLVALEHRVKGMLVVLLLAALMPQAQAEAVLEVLLQIRPKQIPDQQQAAGPAFLPLLQVLL